MLDSLYYPLSFVVALGVLVFVHELGHYLVARWNGIRVEVFSIGFGAELFGWTDRAGTRWKVAAVPLGGYVKMLGDTDPSSTGARDDLPPELRSQAFPCKRVGQRAAVVAAGPAANFLFAIVALAVLYSFSGQPYTAPVISEVTPGSAAEASGLKPGDLVKSIDGTRIERFEDMQRIVMARPGEALSVLVERDGAEQRVAVTPMVQESTDRFGNRQRTGLLGVRSTQVRVVQHDPATAVWQATKETWNLSVSTLHALGQMVVGSRSTDEIGGILRIGKMAGDVAREGATYYIWFLAVLSINLGLINLFPIPVLDGGHLVFLTAEAIRGRPLGKRVIEWGGMAGLAAVLALMVFATWNDLVHLRVVAFLSSLIS